MSGGISAVLKDDVVDDDAGVILGGSFDDGVGGSFDDGVGGSFDDGVGGSFDDGVGGSV